MDIRRLITIDEEVFAEGGRPSEASYRKVAAVAIVTNPHAGTAIEDLTDLIDLGGELGTRLARRVLEVADASEIESFGKACIIGERGEIEHAAALIHPTFGKALRDVIGGGAAIIPSTKKLGGPGTRIDIPLVFKEDAAVASHFDTIEVGFPDSPKADEALVAFGIATGGRPHARIPGRTVDQALAAG